MSTVFAYVKASGFKPPDEGIYNRLTSSLSLSLLDQTRISYALSAFSNLCRRNHFLKFAAATVSDGQKARLMSGDPFQRDLFDSDTLKAVTSEFEGAAATSSHLDVSKAVAKGLLSFSKNKQSDATTTRSPVVPPRGISSSGSSRSSVAALFESRGSYRGRGGHRRGGRGGNRGRGAPVSQKSADQQQTFQK